MEQGTVRAAACALAVFLISSTGAWAQDAVKGSWLRGDGVARVIVSACGAALCMKNTWIKPGSSEKVGEYLVLNVRPSGENTWSGRGHDPQRDVGFSANMSVSGDRMTTSGCVAGGLICRTTQWTRLK